MKIGIVAPGGFDRAESARVVPAFLWLAERLARRHDVHVFSLYQEPPPDEYRLMGFTVHNVGGRVPGPAVLAAALRALRREHADGRFDILHGLRADAAGLVAAVAGRLWRVPTVVTLAGGELVSLPEIGYGGQLHHRSRLQIGLALRLADVVTAASEATCAVARAHRPDVRRIVVGVDTARFAPPAQPPPGPPWRLLHVTRLDRVKDPPTLVRAFGVIRASEPHVHLDVIGEDTRDGAAQRLARELGLADEITFHGFRPSEVVVAHLQRAHLLLHSSLSEMGPAVFLEAAACAVPTVGTAVGLIRDLAPRAAAAVPVGDHQTLAEVALALLHDTPSREALGQRALAFARHYDADWTAARFETVYQDLAARRSPRSDWDASEVWPPGRGGHGIRLW